MSMKTSSILSIFIFMMVVMTGVYSCKKREAGSPKVEIIYDSIYDIDSNKYKIVKIGEDWWMAEDLRVTRFRDSTFIPQVQAKDQWLTAGSSYCLFQGNPQALSLLYNWSAVNDSRGIAPLGWHIASDEEWKRAEQQIGMSVTETDGIGWRGQSAEAKKIKTEERKGWFVSESTWPDNNSGLSLSGIGGRVQDGAWSEPGLFSQGFWWTTSKSGDRAIYRHLDYKYNEVFRDKASLHFGMAVRCVKDR